MLLPRKILIMFVKLGRLLDRYFFDDNPNRSITNLSSYLWANEFQILDSKFNFTLVVEV